MNVCTRPTNQLFIFIFRLLLYDRKWLYLLANKFIHMATIKTIYLGDLRTENTHIQSGNKVISDAPLDNRGRGEFFSPTDLLATALGSCIMTIMGIKARDHDIDITGTEVEVTKIMASDPRRVAEVVVEFNFPRRHYPDASKRLIESVAGISPVPLSLHPELKQTILFNWRDPE